MEKWAAGERRGCSLARSHLGVVCTGLWLKYVCRQGRRARVQAGKRFPRHSMGTSAERARLNWLPACKTTTPALQPWISQNCCKLSPPARPFRHISSSFTNAERCVYLIIDYDGDSFYINAETNGPSLSAQLVLKLIFYAWNLDCQQRTNRFLIFCAMRWQQKISL